MLCTYAVEWIYIARLLLNQSLTMLQLRLGRNTSRLLHILSIYFISFMLNSMPKFESHLLSHDSFINRHVISAVNSPRLLSCVKSGSQYSVVYAFAHRCWLVTAAHCLLASVG